MMKSEMSGSEAEVRFSVDKVGFHFIKVTKLYCQIFDYKADDIMDGALQCSHPLTRSEAEELRKKFEALGATVSVKNLV